MDPISALGAAGSVVGIAGFGLQLSKVLYQFTTQALSAPESLYTILSGITATTCALNLVHDFLKEECQHLEQKGQALLFSPKAITDVKRIADGCLMIFWRIEATITCKAGSKFESTLAERLDLFNVELSKEDRGPVVLDPELSKLNLSQIGTNQSAALNENLTGFARRRLESPIGARDGLHPFVPQGDTLRRLSLSPRRRHLSPVRVGVAKRDTATNNFPPQTAGGLTREAEPESSTRALGLDDIPRKSKAGKEKAKVQSEILVDPDLQAANGNSSLETVCTLSYAEPLWHFSNGRTFGLVDENDPTTSPEPVENPLDTSVPVNRWSQDITDRITTNSQEEVSRGHEKGAPEVIPGLRDTIQSEGKAPSLVNTPEPTPVSNPGNIPARDPVREPLIEQRLHLSSDDSGQTGAMETPMSGATLQTPQQASQPIAAPSVDIPTIVEHLTTPISTINVDYGLESQDNQGFFGRDPDQSSHDPSASTTQYGSGNQADFRYKMTSTMQSEQSPLPRSQENSQDVDELSDLSRTRNRTTRNRSSIGRRPSPSTSCSAQSSSSLGGDNESKDLLSRMKKIFNSGRSIPDPFITAYFIKNGEAHQVPHSGNLKLTQSLKRSIETQSIEQSWHKTFAFMDPDDLGALQEVIGGGGTDLNRKIVDLKKIRENRAKFWKSGIQVHFAVIRDFPPEAPSIASGSRSLLETQESQTGNSSNYRRGRRPNAERSYPWIAQDPSGHPTEERTSQNIGNHQVAPTTSETLSQAHASSQLPTSNQWPQATQQASLPAGGPMFNPHLQPYLPPNPLPLPKYIPTQAPRVPGAGPGGTQPENTLFRRPPQQSVRIQDISPPKVLNEEMCLKMLTSYSMYTIYRAPKSEAFGDLSTWGRAEVIEEQLSQLDIITQIDKLRHASLPVVEKKAALSRDQQAQITALLDNLALREMDANFSWVLEQLDTKSAVVEGKRKKMTFEDITILVFAKRAPIPNANHIMLYQAIERFKAAMFTRPPPPPPAPQGFGHSHRTPPPPLPAAGFAAGNGGPSQQKPVPILQQQKGSSKGKSVSMNSPISSVFKKKKQQRGSDSSDSYDSGSDSSSYASSTSSISMTTRPGRSHHRRGRRHESHRMKGSRDRSRERTPSPRSNRNSRSGSVQPRPNGADPMVAAYNAGKEDGWAERSANERSSRYPSEPQSSAHYNYPESSFRADQYIQNRRANDTEVSKQPPLWNANLDRWSSERDYHPTSYDRGIQQRRQDADLYRPEYRSDAEIAARRGTRDERRPFEQSRSMGINSYPQYHDSKRYDPRFQAIRSGRKDEDGKDDVVEQLLLEWTPQQTDTTSPEVMGSNGETSNSVATSSKKGEVSTEGKHEKPASEGNYPALNTASRQTTVDDVIDELDQRRTTSWDIASSQGSDYYEKGKKPAQSEYAARTPEATDAKTEKLLPPVHRPQAQPPSQPWIRDPSWSQKIVETTALKHDTADPESRFRYDPSHSRQYGSESRYFASPRSGSPVFDDYSMPGKRPTNYPYKEDVARERGRPYGASFNETPLFRSREGSAAPNIAKPPASLPPRASSISAANFENGW
ncbi:hypothetical protein IFR05_011592 [Cadophora sp. M221]|nr:hypothetical protein IFR05_011592 [Cadophora sp. M221]